MGDLVLPGAVSATSLDLPPGLSYDEWARAGQTLARIERACMWWIGDWWHYGVHAYGERASQVLDMDTYVFQTFMDAGWVAGKIPTSRRREVLSWSHHREVAALDPHEQDYWLDRAEQEGLSRNDLRRDIRRPALGPAPEVPEGEYAVILADPPWPMDNAPLPSRGVENHYETMPLDDILALDFPKADHAVLFLWTTNARLIDALEVAAAWGFEYRTNFTWVKDRIGLGHWNRLQHELLLVCRRGDMSPPAEGDRVSSVIHAPAGRHSEKPVEVHEAIERMYPDLPKLELFARRERDGWATWGNEVAALA